MKIVLVRGLAALSLLAVGVLAASCGGGLSTEEATSYCDRERKSQPCLSDAAYKSCISCYEDCGVDCTVSQGDCSPTYTCD